MNLSVENYRIGLSSKIEEPIKVINKNLTVGALVVNKHNDLLVTKLRPLAETVQIYSNS